MNPTISVIVPVYKAELYLGECIDSILEQTFKDFELILVDDGSPDRSGAICDEYASTDPRIRVHHKPNGGVSTARNAGLDTARGQWITFVDADDRIDKKYLESLLKTVSESKADVATGTIRFVYSNGSTHDNILWSPTKDNKDEIADYILSPWTCLCGNLIKRDLLMNNKSPEGITLCEDFHVMVRVIFNAEKVVASTDAIYFYREQPESICHNISTKEYESARKVYSSTIDFFKATEFYEQTKTAMSWRMISACIDLISDKSGFDRFTKLNNPHKNLISSCPFISKKLKLIMWCLTHNMRPLATAAISLRSNFSKSKRIINNP